jgi:serpin B
MKRIVYSLIIPVFIFLWSCSEDMHESDSPIAPPIELRSDLQPRVEQDNTFALDLFKVVYESAEVPNVFISPLSVSMALSMTMNGAKGATRDEMETALRISGFSEDEINEYCKTLRAALLSIDPQVQINIANSIWYHMGFPVENYFVQTNKTNFDAEIKEVDFMDSQTVKLINEWCANNTKNKIPKIVDRISPNTLMCLINAVYFKGMWRMKFEKKNTLPKPFYYDNDQVKQVDMMNLTSEFNYTSDKNARYVELPYGNEAFSMVVILPNEDKTINDVVNGLDVTSWNNVLNSFHSRKINLELPRFKAKCGYQLQDNLKRLGMEIPFTGLADFTGISRSGGLSISDVIHQTFVEVNEEGTEAAAVTVVGMFTSGDGSSGSSVIDFFVNKPFLFVIKEKSTNVILFMGKMGEIE